jgi:hypothetical protein
MVKRASQQVFARRVGGQPGLVERLLDLVGDIPTSDEPRSDDPRARSRALARAAAARSASAAGTLALPPGPLGWITIAPELYAVWKIQAQMVADIAAAHGKHHLLTREQMLYCLFSHTAAGAFRDLVIRMGERFVVRRAPLSALYAIANKIAIRIAQRSAGRLVTRWIPVLGALGVAGYVYIDTGRVADASIPLFAADIIIEDGRAEDEAAHDGSGRDNAHEDADPGETSRKRPARRPASRGGEDAAASATKKKGPPARKASVAKAAGTAPAARKARVGRSTARGKKAASTDGKPRTES